MEDSMTRKYAAWLTDKEGVDHLYAMAENIHDAYDIFLEDMNLWFDPVLKNDEELEPRYSVTLYHPSVLVNFGSTKPVEVVERSTLVGTYGQLETAFRIKYENEDEEGRWDIEVAELTVYGKQAEFVIIDEILP
jgi:hypothetical protein